MVQENEIVLLILGIGVLVFVLGNRQRLQKIPASNFLLSGYYMMLAGWFLTVLEGFFLSNLINYLEHICYAASSIITSLWFLNVFGYGKVEK